MYLALTSCSYAEENIGKISDKMYKNNDTRLYRRVAQYVFSMEVTIKNSPLLFFYTTFNITVMLVSKIVGWTSITICKNT